MDGDSWWYTLWRWATSGRKRSIASAMPRCASRHQIMRPTILARSTTPDGGLSNSTKEGKVSARSTWVFCGCSIPQYPTV